MDGKYSKPWPRLAAPLCCDEGHAVIAEHTPWQTLRASTSILRRTHVALARLAWRPRGGWTDPKDFTRSRCFITKGACVPNTRMKISGASSLGPDFSPLAVKERFPSSQTSNDDSRAAYIIPCCLVLGSQSKYTCYSAAMLQDPRLPLRTSAGAWSVCIRKRLLRD